MITSKTRLHKIECENTTTGERVDMGFAPCLHEPRREPPCGVSALGRIQASLPSCKRPAAAL